MDTVLAGPDGKGPAIDQATQQPLTIEELLRRRGLLAVGGNTRVNGQAPTTPASDASTNPLVAALAARASGNVPSEQTSNPVDPTTGQPVPNPVVANGNMASAGMVGSQSATPIAAMSMPSVDPNSLAPAAIGAAAGLGYALAGRRKKQGAGPNKLQGGDSRPSPKPGQMANGNASRDIAVMPGTSPSTKTAVRQSGMIEGTRQLPNASIDGEFSEVSPLLKVLTDKRVLKALTRIR